MLKVEEHKCARLNVDEGVRLALELIRIAEGGEEHHTRLKAEEEARLVEESRPKLEEEGLRLRSEDEARLVEEGNMKSEQEEQARLNAKE